MTNTKLSKVFRSLGYYIGIEFKHDSSRRLFINSYVKKYNRVLCLFEEKVADPKHGVFFSNFSVSST